MTTYTLAISAFLLLILSGGLVVASIRTRKAGTFVKAAVVFLGFIALSGYIAYRWVNKLNSHLREITHVRSGEEIYQSYFGKDPHHCTTFTEYQDNFIMRADVGVYLHFKTCPAEFARITDTGFTCKKIKTTEAKSNDLPAWFSSIFTSDSLTIYQRRKDNNHVITMVPSADSTDVYFVETGE